MAKKNWCNLHNHGIFSNLDGHGPSERYAERAKELGQPAIAITDHGNVGGIYDHYEACLKWGVKPILGAELYQARKTRHDRDPEEMAGRATYEFQQRGPYHITALAYNNAGYKNLIKLSSRAFTEGYYGKARTDHELLADHSEGIKILSGCLSGEVQQALLRDDYDAALQSAGTMQDIIGKDDYYIEIMDHHLPEEHRVKSDLIRIAKTIGAKLVPTGDSHYVLKEDHDAHDAMLCVGTKSLLADENRFRFSGPEYYLKSYEEMNKLFPDEWLKNTMDIAESCEVEIEFDNLYFPSYPDVPEGHTSQSFFIEETWKGLHEIYGDNIPQEVIERTNYELSVVLELGYHEYYLVIADIIKEAKNGGVNIGFGRGCLTPEVPVWTRSGFKRIEDVSIGDTVIGHSGNPRRVTNTFVYNVNEPIYTITVEGEDGTAPIRLTGDHKVAIRRPDDDTGPFSWVEAESVKCGDFVVIPRISSKLIPELDNDMRHVAKTSLWAGGVASLEIANGNVAPQVCDDDEYMYMKVNSVTCNDYSGKVHDIEVERDHSFMTDSFIVHNSAAGSMLSYANKVTGLDPLEFGLLFERFLLPTESSYSPTFEEVSS